MVMVIFIIYICGFGKYVEFIEVMLRIIQVQYCYQPSADV